MTTWILNASIVAAMCYATKFNSVRRPSHSTTQVESFLAASNVVDFIIYSISKRKGDNPVEAAWIGMHANDTLSSKNIQ